MNCGLVNPTKDLPKVRKGKLKKAQISDFGNIYRILGNNAHSVQQKLLVYITVARTRFYYFFALKLIVYSFKG